MMRLYGYGLKGLRVHDKHRGKSPLYTLVACVGLTLGLHAMWLQRGWMTADDFVQWVINELAPTLRRGDVVVLDNCRIHKDPRVEAAIQARGARVLPLPPYTPEYNPIEECWSKMKAILRELRPQTPDDLAHAISEGAAAITHRDILAYFRHAGVDVEWYERRLPSRSKCRSRP